MSIRAQSENVEEFNDLPTRFRVCVGLDESINQCVLKDQKPENSYFFLKFKVDNPSVVAGAMEEMVEELKSFIGEINESLQPIIDQLEINVLTLDDGVAMTLNLDSHPILGPYAMMANMATEPVSVFEPTVEFKLGSSKALSDGNLLGGKGYASFTVNSKSIVDALVNNKFSLPSKEMESKLHSAIKKKMGIEVSMFLSLINAKSLDLCLTMYEVDANNFEFKVNLKETVKKALEKNSENPALAVLRSMEFVKEFIDNLSSNGVSEMNVGVGAGKANARIDVAADLTEIFEMIFADDED